ncbi:MAG TPA: hypothetical protein VE782_10420, partial [Myxococcaceae bacterium]|nr:hypothetical protein [Myxococcaceae bacterium]
PLFVDSGTFGVNGDVVVQTDLQPVPGANSYAYIGWNFPPNSSSSMPTCADAGVSRVRVAIDYGPWTEYPCTDAFNTAGVVTDWLTSGPHTIELEGLGADGYRYYRYVGTLTTSVGNHASAVYTVGWSVGGVSVQWRPASNQFCASGATTAYVNFWDVQNQAWVYPGYPNGDSHACVDGYFPVLYNYLQAGTYDVWVRALDSSGYWMESIVLQRITIEAGQFVDASSPSVVVQLY